MFLWSLLGACGTGFARNLCCYYFGPNDTVTKVTWVYEWLCLVLILVDLFKHLTTEWTYGMNVPKDALPEIEQTAVGAC